MSKIAQIAVNSRLLPDNEEAVVAEVSIAAAVDKGTAWLCWCGRPVASQYGRPTLRGAIKHEFCDSCGYGAIEFDPPTAAQIAEMIRRHLL